MPDTRFDFVRLKISMHRAVVILFTRITESMFFVCLYLRLAFSLVLLSLPSLKLKVTLKIQQIIFQYRQN